MHTGSAFILIGSFFGAVPSSVTVPLMSPAVAVSTFWPAPAPAGAAGAADVLDVSLLPPHAASDAAIATPRTPAQTFRKRIDISSGKKTNRNQALILPCFVEFPLDAVRDPVL